MLVPQWDADFIRQNEIVIAGPGLLVFTSYVVRHLKPLVSDQLTRFCGSRSVGA